MSFKNLTSPSVLATVKHNVVNQPPVVSAGELVPCSIYDLKQYCETYFTKHKNPNPGRPRLSMGRSRPGPVNFAGPGPGP